MCWQGARLQLHVGFESQWLARSFVGEGLQRCQERNGSTFPVHLRELMLFGCTVLFGMMWCS